MNNVPVISPDPAPRSLFLRALGTMRLGLYYHGMDKPVSVVSWPMREIAFVQLYRHYQQVDPATKRNIEQFLVGDATCITMGGFIYQNEAQCVTECHKGVCRSSAIAIGPA